MEPKKHLEYNKVDEYIYIGTTICCRKHFEELLAMGIVADIDLQEEKQDKPSGVTAFLWLPTIDFKAPSQSQLFIGAHFIQDLVHNNMKCYVHCNAGTGRAPTMVAAYYILEYGDTPAKAVVRIQENREKASPNEEQMDALERFHVLNKK